MTNSNIKAALFDLDGVVAFSDKYHYEAWKKLADEQGWYFDEKINDRLRGVSRLESLEIILEINSVKATDKQKEEYAETKNDYYKELIKNISTDDLYNGVVEFITALREKGIKTAICSSSKNAEAILSGLGIEYLFDTVVTGCDIKNTKPDPEVFLLGAKKLEIHPFHCVVFEDAVAGIEAAHNAGMRSCGVGNDEVEQISDEFIKEYSEIDIDNFIESGKKSFFKFEAYKLYENAPRVRDINAVESKFALGNGYLGMRGVYEEDDALFEEYVCPGMYINGVFEKTDINHAVYCKGFATHDQYTVNLTDWRLISVYVDGEKMCFSNGKMLSHERYLDMWGGRLVREAVWESSTGKKIALKTVRIVSMEHFHSAAISYSVTPLNFSGEIEIKSEVRAVNPLLGKYATECVEKGSIENTDYITLRTLNTKISVCTALCERLNTDAHRTILSTDNGHIHTFKINAEKDRETVLEKFVSFFDDTDESTDIVREAVKEVNMRSAKGFSEFSENQADFWSNHRKYGEVKIKGNDRDDLAVRFNLFHLRQQIPSVSGYSVGATGLTGPHYSGKVFWDTEMYIIPYLNYTTADITKGLLMYRYKVLDKARERAAQMDGKGALYSWCSVDGEETSIVFEASTAEYHLQSDIAFAIERYVNQTGDYGFLYEYGAEIVFDTAKFMYDRGSFSEVNDGRFCFNAVCGPDEYACGVNNNFYTNMMLKHHFEYAKAVFDKMQLEAPSKLEELCKKLEITAEDAASWKNAAEKMYFKYNEKLGVYEQDDSFLTNDAVDMTKIPKNFDIRGILHPLNLWRIQVLKQADVVLLMFILGENYTKEEKKRSYEYYEPKTNHGSSLSAAIHAVMASEIDKDEQAYEYLRSAVYMDLADFKKNTAGGLHMACLGGAWMTVANGSLGMRDYPSGLLFNPKCPEAWDGYELDILYHGSRIHICVDKEKCVFKLTEGEPVAFKCKGENYFLESELSVKIK